VAIATINTPFSDLPQTAVLDRHRRGCVLCISEAKRLIYTKVTIAHGIVMLLRGA
jgi:hypothetical protein